jgi:tryptophan synthase alpha chain
MVAEAVAPITGAEAIGRAFTAARVDGRAALIPYAVAGYPDPDRSVAVALAAIDAGADLLEIGLPYSDPLADGPTLQRASQVALAAGTTLDRSLSILDRVRAKRPDVPLVTMGYCNQVLGGRDGAGVLRRLGSAGVSGLILADLTPDEGADLERSAAAEGIALVYLVTPTTTTERRAAITARSQGFVYAVSLTGVTGARGTLAPGLPRFLASVKTVSPVPVAVGFGISRPVHVRRLAPLIDGVVVASALIDAQGPDGSGVERMSSLVRALREATRRPIS